MEPSSTPAAPPRAPQRKRAWLRLVLAVVLLPIGGALGLGCLFAAPRWAGPQTAHFDGTRFKNLDPALPPRGFTAEGLAAVLEWQRERTPAPWGPYHDEPPGPRPPSDVGHGQLRITFINHATTLVQVDGVNVLTDPIYSERCSPLRFAGPKRVRPPGTRFEDLPRIDAVVLSHNHYDHLDVATLQRVQHTWPNARLYAGLGNAAFLTSQGLDQVTELDWWEARTLGPLTLTAVPNQHFSNRGLGDADGTLWTGWVIAGATGYAYFGGDTGYGDHFAQVRDRFGPARAAILPIGAYKPEWFMAPVHMSPAQAVQAAIDLDARLAVPMHYGTFSLADDGEYEPVETLRGVLTQRPAPFAILGFGEGRDVP